VADRSPHLARLVAGEQPRSGARQRAPKRGGQRTQLTVPQSLWAAAQALAEDIGTTPNDVIVRLAGQRLAEAERQAELERIASERWAEFLRATPETRAERPAELDELLEAAAALRRDSA
jgi:hypothetical protein